jgi:uncharacterized protein (DUF433 family)
MPDRSTLSPPAVGRYIVKDPAICHGKLTFRGTRIMVADVLDQIASGLAWETIVEEWGGSVTPDMIAEAVRLAREALVTHAADMVPRSTVS